MAQENLTVDEIRSGNQTASKGLPDGATPAIVGQEATPEDGPSLPRMVLIMLALCMAIFLAALDATIITTALPTIAAHFKASGAEYSWIGSAYLMGSAATVPSWGKFSDIFARKPVLLVANIVFLVGSLICGLAVNIKMLIAGRVFQGVGAGGLMSLVSICISDLFSPRKRGAYYGMVGATWGIASAMGPIIGGALAQKVSWRWCFYINLPFDGLAFLILLFFLDIHAPRTQILAGLKAIDWPGSLTIIGGTVMLLLGLEYGGISYPWSAAIVICLIVFGVVTGALFLLTEWKIAKYAIIPIRIFENPSNLAALAVCFCHGFVFVSGFFFLPMYFQAVLGASPILSGIYLLPFAISLSLMSVVIGILIKMTGRYIEAIRISCLLTCLGFGLFMDLSTHASLAKVIIFQVLAGFGTGPNFLAPLIALQALVSPGNVSSATATMMFMRQISTALSVVIGGVIFQNQMHKHYAMLLQSGVSPQFASLLTDGSAASLTTLVRDLPTLEQEAVKYAFTASLQKTWIIYVCVGMVGFVVSFAIQKQELNKQHEVIETGLEAQERYRIQAEKAKGRNTRGRGADDHELSDL